MPISEAPTEGGVDVCSAIGKDLVKSLTDFAAGLDEVCGYVPSAVLGFTSSALLRVLTALNACLFHLGIHRVRFLRMLVFNGPRC